ncbi:MAG: hypothetical protein QF893_00845 [Alphaproteobacteria bacterium]|nr:hypothetical protein [Alphaproteobacteria bacterium]
MDAQDRVGISQQIGRWQDHKREEKRHRRIGVRIAVSVAAVLVLWLGGFAYRTAVPGVAGWGFADERCDHWLYDEMNNRHGPHLSLGISPLYLRRGETMYLDYEAKVRKGKLEIGFWDWMPQGSSPRANYRNLVRVGPGARTGRVTYVAEHSGLFAPHIDGYLKGGPSHCYTDFEYYYEYTWGTLPERAAH